MTGHQKRGVCAHLAGFALLLFGVWVALAAPATASPPGRFEAKLTEEFVSATSCPEGVDAAAADICGSAKTQRFGKATSETIITALIPVSPGCFIDEHTHTLRFKRGGALVIAVSGTICVSPSGFPNFTFIGTYEVVGGTGTFAGATGTGVQTAFREGGPIEATLSGVLLIP